MFLHSAQPVSLPLSPLTVMSIKVPYKRTGWETLCMTVSDHWMLDWWVVIYELDKQSWLLSITLTQSMNISTQSLWVTETSLIYFPKVWLVLRRAIFCWHGSWHTFENHRSDGSVTKKLFFVKHLLGSTKCCYRRK